MTTPDIDVVTCSTHRQVPLVLVKEGPVEWYFCPRCESEKGLAFLRQCRDPLMKESLERAFLRAPRYRAEVR